MANKKYNSKTKDAYRDGGYDSARNQKNRRRNNKRDWSENDRSKATYVGAVEGKENDPDWYKQIPTLFENATNVSFYNPTGISLPIANEQNFTIPGIMVFNTVITPGTSVDASSGLNMATINLYEMVRKTLNKPNPDYEAQDLGISTYCAINVYALYANICRIFGLLGRWDAENEYTPKALLKLLYGMDSTQYQYAISNLANLRARFNQLIYKSSFIFVPTSMKLMERYAWLFMNVFRDHDTAKSQFYAHAMKGFYLWDETSYETGSAGKWTEFNTFGEADIIGKYLDYFDQAIEALRSSSSFRIMQSDMRKAFENDNAWQLAWMDEAYQTSYTVSDEVLMQIENSVIPQSSSTEMFFGNHDIVQDVNKNIIIFDPVRDYTNDSGAHLAALNLISGDQWLNIHSQDVTKDMVMVVTRGKIAVEIPESEANKAHLLVGSDYINDVSFLGTPSGTPEIWKTFIDPAYWTTYGDRLMYGFVTFDWAPHVYPCKDDGDIRRPIGEWDNVTNIPLTMIKNLHRVATLSMWYSNVFGSWSTV